MPANFVIAGRPLFYLLVLLCWARGPTLIEATANETQATVIDGIIQRLNYGTIFRADGHILLGTEYWHQTFQIQLPDLPNTYSEKEACGQVQGATCTYIKYMTLQIYTLHHETRRKLVQTLHFIENHVPQATHIPSKTKRALFGFVADWSKSIFGTATIKDVQILSQHIKHLTTRTDKVLDTLEQHGQHMSSYMTTTNERVNLLQSHVKNNFKAIVNITETFKTNIDELQTQIVEITRLLYSQTSAANDLENEFLEFKYAVQNLLAGNLSPVLITKATLVDTLKEIQHILDTRYNKFFLTHMNPEWYYRHCNFHYARDDNALYITLKFPLSTNTKPLHIYEIITLPFPISANSQHASQLLDLPRYLAITDHQQYYTYLSQDERSKCNSHPIELCEFNKALRPITEPSCTLGLFANNKQHIK
ncbi:hypothetical protein BOV90_12200, partial [Solemya velum gill symbiont]|uniref:hypothetical protein n=2 Tax=Solemya velum gill symbiont TaxID=2340 RepID=UPI0009C4EA7B